MDVMIESLYQGFSGFDPTKILGGDDFSFLFVRSRDILCEWLFARPLTCADRMLLHRIAMTGSNRKGRAWSTRPGSAFFERAYGLEAVVDGGEDPTNQRAHDADGGDNDHGHEYQDQSVLNQTLSFFLRGE